MCMCMCMCMDIAVDNLGRASHQLKLTSVTEVPVLHPPEQSLLKNTCFDEMAERLYISPAQKRFRLLA